MRDTFILYTNQKDAFDSMTDEQAGQIIKAIFAYVSDEEIKLDGLMKTVFTQIKTQIDYNNDKYDSIKKARTEAGRKGGEASASKRKQNEANESKDNHNDNVNVNDNVNIKRNIKEKPVKHKYGEYGNVLLTDEEFAKIKDKFPSDYQSWIDRLSGYIESKGVKYKSHYATILNWSRNERASPTKVNDFKAHTQQTYDFDELEKKLISNG